MTMIKSGLIATLVFSASASAADVYVIGMSSNLAPPDRTDAEQFITHNLNKMNTGDVFILVDTQTNQRVATIVGNSELSASDEVARRTMLLVKYYPQEVNALRNFLKRPPALGEGNILRFLSNLEPLKAQYPNMRIRVAYFGTPINKEPAAFTLENSYPSDGNFFDPNSVYSTVNKKGILKEMDIHIIHSQGLGEFSTVAKDMHIEKLKRFYAIYVSQMGGQLKSFQSNSQSLFGWKNTNYQSIIYEVGRSENKAMMIELRAPQRIQEDKQVIANLWDSKISANPSAPTKTSGALTLGIKWNRDVDVDLYSKASVDDKELFYGENNAPKFGGRHLKDITNLAGLSATNGFETITYSGAVDISKMPPIYINHYAGKSDQPIEVELRALFDGKAYFKKFRLPAGNGTSAKGNRNTDPSWIKVTLAELMGGGK